MPAPTLLSETSLNFPNIQLSAVCVNAHQPINAHCTYFASAVFVRVLEHAHTMCVFVHVDAVRTCVFVCARPCLNALCECVLDHVEVYSVYVCARAANDCRSVLKSCEICWIAVKRNFSALATLLKLQKMTATRPGARY